VRRYDSDPGTHPPRIRAVSAPDHCGAASRLAQGMRGGAQSSEVSSVVTFLSYNIF
jgi:hypothetical protein